MQRKHATPIVGTESLLGLCAVAVGILSCLLLPMVLSLADATGLQRLRSSDALALPATGIGHSGRWLTYNGRYEYFVGFDTQELAADASIDYVAALDHFVRYRINKLRIWIYPWFVASRGGLAPWARDASGRHDLDRWDETYWTRVRDFVAAAEDRGIIVEATIFAPNNLDAPSDWSNPAYRSAENKVFNVNGVFSANSRGHFVPQFFDLNHGELSSSGKTLRDYQQALIDKTVAELGASPNVYFEIANEFPSAAGKISVSYPWQQHWARYIKNRYRRIVAVHGHEYVGDHVRGIQYFWDRPYVDVMSFAIETPTRYWALLRGAQATGKVLEINEGLDPHTKLSEGTVAAWNMFTAGGYYAFYEDDARRIGSAGWIAGARRLNVLRDIVESLNFAAMSPLDRAGAGYDALVTQAPTGANHRVIANPGSEYLAYFWGAASQTPVQIELPPGRYAYTFYDPRNQDVLGSGVVSGGAASVPTPAVADWSGADGLVLVLKMLRRSPVGDG